jgi:hypothetical protein
MVIVVAIGGVLATSALVGIQSRAANAQEVPQPTGATIWDGTVHLQFVSHSEQTDPPPLGTEIFDVSEDITLSNLVLYDSQFDGIGIDHTKYSSLANGSYSRIENRVDTSCVDKTITGNFNNVRTGGPGTPGAIDSAGLEIDTGTDPTTGDLGASLFSVVWLPVTETDCAGVTVERNEPFGVVPGGLSDTNPDPDVVDSVWERGGNTPTDYSIQTFHLVHTTTAPPDPLDLDGDGVPDGSDNCDGTPNPDQRDLDNDGVGNLCDVDVDGDGVLNSNNEDNCIEVFNPDQADADNDGVGNACDEPPDSDADGVSDTSDWCPGTPAGAVVTPTGCAVSATDGQSRLKGTGDIGTTCGNASFDWYTSVGQPTSVKSGERACVVLFSNRVLQEMFRLARASGVNYQDVLGQLLTANGFGTIGDAAKTLTTNAVQNGIIRALFPEMTSFISRANLGAFVLQNATLAGGALLFEEIVVDQVYSKGACFQMTVDSENAQLQLDGNFVYNPTHFTDRQGTIAHTHKRTARKFRLDEFSQVNFNMACDNNGMVSMGGGTKALVQPSSWLR